MNLWLLLTAAFLVQEPVSTSVLLLSVYQQHYNVLLIHMLFCATTIFDIVIGYYLGLFIYRKGKIKFINYLKNKFEALSDFLGKRGKILTLVLFSPMIFPISAILLPFLDISFMEGLIYTFLGELIFWYGYEWLLVLGVKGFAHNSQIALYLILAVSLILSLILNSAYKKATRK